METTRHIFAGLAGTMIVAAIGCSPASPRASNPAGNKPIAPTTAPAAAVESAKVNPDARFAAPTEPRPAAGSPISLYGQLAGMPASPVMPEVTDNLRQVTFTSEGNDFDPAIDPTGKWLVFASTRHRTTSDLYLQRVDSNTVTQLTNDPGNDAMPAFAPDGKRVAFCSDRGGSWDIYLTTLDGGGQPVQLTNDSAQNIHPSFSPDGKYLVYCSRPPQNAQFELVVIEVDRPGNKRYLGTGLFPTWSPTDNKIVFQRARERGTFLFSIWTIDFVNGEGLRPTEIVASANAACITPTFSPDGKRIAFATVVNPDGSDRPQQADIWMVSLDGSGRSNLTRSKAVNTQPIWAGDGSVYFIASRSKSGASNVWSLRPERAIAGSESTTATVRPAATSAAAEASGH